MYDISKDQNYDSSQPGQVIENQQNEISSENVYSNSEENESNMDSVQQAVKNADNAYEEGERAGIEGNNTMNKGVTYPIIRINDHYFTDNEIFKFTVESGYYKNYQDYENFQKPVEGFIPTFTLIVQTESPDLLKTNTIKCGDKCAIFFAQGNDMIKSYRADYVITSCVSDDLRQDIIYRSKRFIIKGELYIPNLKSEMEHYNFTGSSRDAIMDAAQKLGINFMFCDPEDTDDNMIWQCTTKLEDFIKEVSMHSWKNFNSFYDCWIDPRYGISFQNINKLLVEEGLDEPIDFTIFTDILHNSRGVDGKKAQKTSTESKNLNRPQAKILTNIADDPDSLSPYFVTSFKIFNQASEIQHAIGLNCTQNYIIDNPGCSPEATEVEMKYSMPINETKLKNGFYVLVGPGRNLTYSGGDEESGTSFVEKSFSQTGGMISETMSDGDAEKILQNSGNTQASGNTHKFYNVAYQHNVRNNLQLQKQITFVELQGVNISITRGEKIPVVIFDNDRVSAAMRQGTLSGKGLQALMYENASGWYIIDGIEWEWTRHGGPINAMTNWKTKLKLVRREWPIPGETYTPGADIDKDQNFNIPVNSAAGTVVNGVNTVTVASEEAADMQEESENGAMVSNDIEQKPEDTAISEVPLTGLKDYMKGIYEIIHQLCQDKVKLVSARRWAVDTDGQRVDGNAFVKKYGYYKCMNSFGEIMYFKSNNSRHLYGEAFDIINANNQDFNSLMTDIFMKDGQLLAKMYQNGVSVFIEQAKDDAGVSTKHYHFGTDTTKQQQFWASVKAINGSTKIPGTQIDFQDYATHNTHSDAEIQHEDVDETKYQNNKQNSGKNPEGEPDSKVTSLK